MNVRKAFALILRACELGVSGCGELGRMLGRKSVTVDVRKA
jgi:hypothetical protein